MSDGAQTAALPRRQVLCGIIAAGLLGPAALAGCSSDSGTDTGNAGNGDTDGTNSPAAGGALAALSSVPVGGGTVVTASDGRAIVLVQPAAGQVKAFDATCTHMGTKVGAPEGGVMTCPNHGSKFSAKDGSVVKGPAAGPLKEVSVSVSGDNIVLA
jgi:cytochrome b6-f complex iron-sulfur subunit